MTKHIERDEARRLRRELGLSINEIARIIGVAKSSVSLWVRDIPLTPEQKLKLSKRKVDGVKLNHWAAAERNRRVFQEQRERYQQEGRERARLQDPLHLAGCMLYWGEGAKGRNMLSMANSDAALMQYFIRFLRECFEIPDEKLTVSINCYLNNDITLREIEDYWLDVLQLPRSCLRKGQVNNQPQSSQQKGRKLLYGTCTLSVYSTQLLQHVFGAIQEYSGIDNPDWVL